MLRASSSDPKAGIAEHHFHSYERWFEVAASPSGETHVADPIGSGSGAFQIDADNDDWGSWVQILGSSDTPAISGKVKYDLHRIVVSATERDAIYFAQIAFGTSGAAALAAGTYTEIVIHPISNQVGASPIETQIRRADSGTKAWMRCKCPGNDTGTMDIYPGIHEYNR